MNATKPFRLTDAERVDWLRLIRSENIGPRTFHVLLAHYGTAARALGVLPDLARRGGARAVKIVSRGEAQREIEMAAHLGARFIASVEPDYPPSLAATDTAPPLIAVRGDPSVLKRPIVAIVGSRNASAAGLTFTERLADGLARAGFVIASGLARGIDKRAHEASLLSGTIAVIAGGQDRVYPPEHEPLLERILEHGAAMSEMPMGWEARGRDFPRRNRIVAGIALGTIVVEAARRSGSLITARLANEQGREVFAVPGSPLDPRAEGTNDLLRQGATLCTRPSDVIDALAPRIDGDARSVVRGAVRPGDLFAVEREGGNARSPSDAADEGRLFVRSDEPADHAGRDMASRIADFLGPSPIGIDEIARAAGAPVRDVQLALLELELAGRLARHGGNLVSRLPDG